MHNQPSFEQAHRTQARKPHDGVALPAPDNLCAYCTAIPDPNPRLASPIAHVTAKSSSSINPKAR